MSTQLLAFPRVLTIGWSDNEQYWKWNQVDHCGYKIEEAELLRVSWFDCFFDMSSSNFKPNTWYTVNMEVKLKDNAYGWDFPVTKKIVMPDGSVEESQEILKDKPKNVWFKILMGKFLLGSSGLIRFQLSQVDTNWKSGIIIRALVVET